MSSKMPQSLYQLTTLGLFLMKLQLLFGLMAMKIHSPTIVQFLNVLTPMVAEPLIYISRGATAEYIGIAEIMEDLMTELIN